MAKAFNDGNSEEYVKKKKKDGSQTLVFRLKCVFRKDDVGHLKTWLITLLIKLFKKLYMKLNPVYFTTPADDIRKNGQNESIRPQWLLSMFKHSLDSRDSTAQ